MCQQCRYSYTNTNHDAIQAARFRLFITWLTEGLTLNQVARRVNKSPRTLQRWFEPFWLIEVPDIKDKERIYDQIFIDGTYFNTTCLLIASTGTKQVLAWHWCYTENSWSYSRLLDKLNAPIIVTTDGDAGALKAIRQTWPTSHVQRCLIHVYRTISRGMGHDPYLPANKALKKLGRQLHTVRTLDDAAEWVATLQRFWGHFGDWLNERTYVKEVPADHIPKAKRHNKVWWYTHYQQRRSYKTLESLYTKGHLFTYLTATDNTVEGAEIRYHTNTLEGGINKEIKKLLRLHNGLRTNRQRIACDWWLYLHTRGPDDPVKIARAQHWGQDSLAKVKQLTNQEKQAAHGHDDGRPALYDRGIEPTPTNSMGIRRGTEGMIY